jgi:hypothetical protein
MSSFGTPAAAGPTPETPARDLGGWLRLLGGLLFGAGAVVLALRKSGDWSDWAIFLVFLVAVVVLYGVALAGSRGLVELHGWESAFYAFAILLLPITLLALVGAIDNDADGSLNSFWIFALSAAVAAFTALRRGALWQMLIAGLYATGSWIALWSKIFGDDFTTNKARWLLIVFAAILLVGAAALARAARPPAADLVTAAGVAAVLAGALAAVVQFRGLTGTGIPFGGGGLRVNEGWNIFLLVVSVGLIAYGTRSVTRGPAYVGGLGFAIFIGVVGGDLVGRLNGDAANKVAGWPLVLLIVGALALIASFVLPRGSRGAAAPGGALLDEWRTQPPPPQ